MGLNEVPPAHFAWINDESAGGVQNVLTYMINSQCRLLVCAFQVCLFFFLSFLAALSLCCCIQAFRSCGNQGCSLVVVLGFLIVVASLMGEHAL